METTYYDIDDILTDGRKIPVVFQVTVPGMGYLEHGHSTSKDLKEGARMELPLWLAEVLAVSGVSDELQTGFVTVATPTPLGPKVVNALRADATNVDLRSQSQQFYSLAERWFAMAGDDEEANMLSTIMDSLKVRTMVINDYAHNTRSTLVKDSSEFLGKLDDTEIKLYRAAHESSKELKKWLSIQK